LIGLNNFDDLNGLNDLNGFHGTVLLPPEYGISPIVLLRNRLYHKSIRRVECSAKESICLSFSALRLR
jgi:hypothetical protein